MVKRILLLIMLTTSAAYAALPARTMYEYALSREKVVRTALSNPDAPPSILAELRGVVAAYELIVRRYSTSGYSDNALWQAGTLSLDAFARFGHQRDRDTGVRLLRKLATVYVNSSLASKVPAVLTRTREAALLRRAETKTDGSREKIELLERAFALQPKNSETAYAIGEQWRAIAWMGRDDYQAQARQALEWYQRALALNRWDELSNIRAGMCLDWLGRTGEAEPYFIRAIEIDPNHWHARAMMGWHEFQKENYPVALEWFKKSLALNWTENPTAYTYFGLSEKYIREDAAGIKRL